MLSEQNKKLLINISILSGMFLGALLILVGMIFLGRASWRNGLMAETQLVLDEYSPKTYKAVEFVEFPDAQSTSCAIYKVKNIKIDDAPYFAVIIRIPTLAGPAPAVFLYSRNTTSFAGYAINNGKAYSINGEKVTIGSINYWKNKIPHILKDAGVING